MLIKRRKIVSSFSSDGRRLGGAPVTTTSSSIHRSSADTLSTGDGTDNADTRTNMHDGLPSVAAAATTTRTEMSSSSSSSLSSKSLVPIRSINSSKSCATSHLRNNSNCTMNCSRNLLNSSSGKSDVAPAFTFGKRLIVQRAPIMAGLTVKIGSAGLLKPFQRPKMGRRAYKGNEDLALKQASLGPKRTMGGMARLLSRAGKGLNYSATNGKTKASGDGGTDESSDEEGGESENDRPYEPLIVWNSPHQGGEARGLPSTRVTEIQTDDFGVEETVTVMKSAPLSRYSPQNVVVPQILGKWLRPHQREGVHFMYQCVMGLKDYEGNGCILADDMGLGKTLQSVTLIYTLLKTGITADKRPTARRVIVVCPCSLVKNWDNEFVKWLGPGTVKTLALAEADRKQVEKDLDSFVKTSIFQILICSYECLRTHVGRLTKHKDCCDLLVCDEAHRLKNSDNQTSKALSSLPVKRRVLLTGTPMQNDLQEFFAMVDFTNPGILGTQEEFRKSTLFPILRGREPDATERQKQRMMEIQNDMSCTVNEFILRRINTLNAQHLPPKLVQVVCCNLTEIQQNMYQHLITSKDMQHVIDGKQVNCLGSIQMLMKLCNHPSLVAEEDQSNSLKAQGKRRAATKQVNYKDGDDENNFAAPGADGISKFLPFIDEVGGRGNTSPVHPEWSGKMFVLYRLMKEMRKPGNGNDKIVIISNYTQTLDLIGRMCRENSWGFCRLDGSVTMKKRQKMVDEFNDPSTSLIAFLLSSKAGGCGLNLIGGNRLVLFDPDWNPAVDKQAAARCWRDGQKKRCFTYRFLATGTVEEKIFQRQLSKEGLQSVVDDKEQVNALSTKDLRNLFKLRTGTPSDTHDKLKCERCKIIHDYAEMEALKVLPKKLDACQDLISKMSQHEDAEHFLNPLVPQDYGVSKEDYEKAVKQPIDLGTIQKRLQLPQDSAQSYKSVSNVSKDVNRIFANVMKVWSPEKDPIADAARRLQGWWVTMWSELVPVLMTMKADSDDNPSRDITISSDDGTNILECSSHLHNERGDDYQEQIGMPDEENMRCWSHHHRTDTVDDPVFRAAMRGCDSVSFVFGLEVTWSLIQQRQQEEDDMRAMKELESMEELQRIQEEAEDNENDDENDDEVVKDDPVGAVGGNESEHLANDEDESDKENHDISDNQADDMKTDESDNDNDVDESKQVGSNHASADLVDSPDGSDERMIVSEADEDSPPLSSYKMNGKVDGQQKTEEVKNSVDGWPCPGCTFVNTKSDRKCSMCSTKQPQVRRSKKRLHCG